MRLMRLPVKVQQHFSPVETVSSKKGILGKNALLDTPR